MTHQQDTAVVFFSRGGNTRLGAEILSERLSARLVELKERRPGSALMALLRMKSQLEGDPWKEIVGVRRVYLMSPIWAGSTAPAMNAFAAGADFTDKDVYVVTFQNAPDENLVYREQQHLAGVITKNHGSVRQCYALLGAKRGQFAGRERILSEIGKVRLSEDLTEAAAAAPVQQEAPVTEEAPAAESAPTEEPTVFMEALTAEEAPAEEILTAEEAPAEETLTAEETPETDESPAAEPPATEVVSVVEEAPALEEATAVEAPTTEDVPAAEEAPVTKDGEIQETV